MNIQAFAVSLTNTLETRNIPRKTAEIYVRNLLRTLTEEDIREISQYQKEEDFLTLTDSLAEIIQNRMAKARSVAVADPEEQLLQKTPATEKSAAPNEMPTQKVTICSAAATGTFQRPAVKPPSAIQAEELSKTRISEPISAQDIWLEEEPTKKSVSLTSRGKGFFWGLAIVTLPLSISFFALTFLAFFLCVAAVCILIGASFLLIGAEAIAGTAAFLVGTIYGVIQICTTSVGIGIYEIGLGIICTGLAMGLGILTYHFAILVLPYVLRQVVQFFRHFLGQVGPFINRCREECNKL